MGGKESLSEEVSSEHASDWRWRWVSIRLSAQCYDIDVDADGDVRIPVMTVLFLLNLNTREPIRPIIFINIEQLARWMVGWEILKTKTKTAHTSH